MAKGELVGRVSTWQAIKAAVQMRFPNFSGSAFSSGNAWIVDNNFVRNIINRFASSSIDFQQEAGDPTLSSLVMAAVNWWGQTLPEPPLLVVEMDGEGKEKPLPGHPAAQLLSNPNPAYDRFALWQAFPASWIPKGNVYWLKARNARGQVIQLWHVPYWMMRPRWPGDGQGPFERPEGATIQNPDFISYFEYFDGLSRYSIRVDDVVHFRNGLDATLRYGVSPIESVYREIYKDNQEANYGALLAKNGAVPPVVLSVKEDIQMDDVDLKKAKADYQVSTQGDERGKVFISNYPVEVTKLGFTPDEYDLRAAHRFNEERFAAVIGIDAIVLGFGVGLEASTYNNTEQADKRTTRTFLVPRWGRIETALTHQLGPDFGLKPNQRFAFDLTKVRALQQDEDALAKRAMIGLTGGGMTLNEYRSMLSLPPDPAGDYYLRRAGVSVVTPEIVQAQIEQTLNPPEPIAQPGQPNGNQPEQQRGGPGAQKRFRLPFQYSLKAKFDFSSTQVNLPDKLAALVVALGNLIPDEDLADHGREDEPHITVRYGLHTQKAADVEAVLADAAPAEVTFGEIDYFAGDEFDVVFVSVVSPDLQALNAKLADLPHTDTHDGYTPHATVAYVKPGLGKNHAGNNALEGVEAVFDEVAFSTKGGKPTTIKLTGVADPVAVLVEYLGLHQTNSSIKRKPTEHEAKQTPAIAKAQDAARADVSSVLSQIRARLITDGLAAVPALADDYTGLKLELTATQHNDLSNAVTAAYAAGQKTANSESKSVKGLLGSTARIIKAVVAAIVSRVTSRIVDEYSRAQLRGLDQAEALKQVEQILADEPAAYVEEIASGAAYQAVGDGRLDELKAMARPGDRFLYSTIGEGNVCEACKADDLKEADDPAKLPPAPNPLCKGRWRCRCSVIIAND